MTAEEFLNKKYPEFEDLDNGNIWSNIENLMVEFAQYHVKEALKAAWENAETICVDKDGSDACDIDKESILNAYLLENIK